jgi:type VII secretion integral membrane protein EccD
MTLPPSLSELDSESDEEHTMSRITVLVGELSVDVGLPTRVSISALVDDVIELANDQLATQTHANVVFGKTDDEWTFARITGGAIDPDRSLAEAGVSDGDLLLLQELGTPSSSLLVDDLDGVGEGGSVDPATRWFAGQERLPAWSALSIALTGATALLFPTLSVAPAVAGVSVTAAVSLLAGLGCAVVGWLLLGRLLDAQRSAWLVGMSLPLLFGGALHVIPGGGGGGITALPMAMALTALVALVQLLVSGRGRPLYTAVIAVAVFGIPAALAQLLLNPNPRAVGTISATVAVIVVYLAPRVTISLSRLPVPRVPTAGEPLQDIETMGGTAVEGVSAVGKQVIPTEEGMTERVRRASEYMSGIVAAAAILAIVGCYLAVDVSAGFFWQGTAFAVAVATVLCLRGRSHHDLIQSAVLIGGGLVIAFAVIVKTATHVDGWQVNAALALVALTVLSILCGLVAPRVEFSPVMRRWVEILEYVAIGLVFPLAGSIIGLYAYFRGLRI